MSLESAQEHRAPPALIGRDEAPCSHAQLRLWFEEQLHPQNPALNVAVRWRLEGELSDGHFRDAWQRLVARHASLRTAFSLAGGEPVQLIEERAAFAVRSIDLRALDLGDAERAAAQLAQTEAHKPFDLESSPLIRVTRLLLDDRTSELLVTAHHTICDGWSVGILAREMGLICAALAAGTQPELPELPIDYATFAQWDRERLTDGSLSTEIAAAQRLLHNYKQFELMTDYPRPALQTSHGDIVSVLMPRSLTDAVAQLARERGCTMFMTALAALYALLHRYSGECDITLGTQVVGRDEVELEGVVGCFINTLALRCDVSGNPTLAELLERAADTVSCAFDLRALPLEALIDIVKPQRDPSRNALFSVNFIFQRSFIENREYGAFRLIDLPSRSAGALYDLNFFMVERPEGWRVACEYNTDLFRGSTVSGMLDRFMNVLHAIVADIDCRLSAVPVLGAADRRALIVDANQTQREYPAELTVAQLFAAQAARTPHAPALLCNATALTYAELDAASDRLAHALSARGYGRGMRVGIVLERSPELLIALLATVKCGAAYVPLDPNYPAERLAYIFEAARLAVAITSSTLRDRFAATDLAFVCVDDGALGAEVTQPFDIVAAPADTAYILFTSGSTGLPKGVEIPHRALVNLLWSMRERPGIGAADTLVAVSTVSFDIAGLELFLPLVSGAKLVIATNAQTVDADALSLLLHRHDATIMQATPVTWQLLVDAGWRGAPAFKILCGGEALSRKLADELLERGEVWNMYGPTETTIWSATARVERGDEPVSIGRPIANTQFYVRDDNGELVPPGAPGELYIGGDGVARGYFDRPDLSAERFVPDPYATAAGARLYRTGDSVRLGNAGYEFLGRRDSQIKLRGFRIELGEIEAALLRESAIAQAVALVGKDVAGEPAIWAAIVPAPGVAAPTQASLDELRVRLGEFLPKYMLPAPIVSYSALPRTPNGKVDRAALRQPTFGPAKNDTRIGVDAPAGPIETTLAQFVAELVGRGEFTRTDDFFALGFHSLLAVRLVARIAQTFGVKLPLRAIFDHPNVAALAARITDASAVGEQQGPLAPFVTFNVGGSRPPFFFLHNDVWFEGRYCRRLAAFVGADQPFVAVAPHGTAGLPRKTSIESMARDYFDRIRAIAPAGPYRIGGSCAGGLVAFELARMLRAQGEVVEYLAIVNTSTPPKRGVLFGDWLLRRVGFNVRLDARVREVFCWNAVRFFDALGVGPRTTYAFISGRLRAAFARANPDIFKVSGTDASDPFDKRSGTPETENHFTNLISAYTYHPKAYDGALTLIMGVDQRSSGDPTMGWGALTAGVALKAISGGYLMPLRNNIDDLGRVLGETLGCTSSGRAQLSEQAITRR